jgi:hypothetical protein
MADVVTYQDRAELAELVSRQRHRQVYSLRLMAASAIAAAGQVRDTRLDRLENPTPPPQPDLWFDLLFEVALSSAFSVGAGVIVRTIAKPIIAARRMPSANLAPRPRDPSTLWVPRSIREDPEKALNEADQLLAARASAAAEAVKERNKELEELWAGFASGAADNLADLGKKHWDEHQAAKEKLPFGWPFPPEQDSPASLVEEAVLRGVARHEAAVGVVFDAFLSRIYDPDLKPVPAAVLRKVLQLLAALPRVDESAARQLRLYYETCIWCLMYPAIVDVKPMPELAPPQVRMVPRVQLLIDAELATYLVRRLPRPGGKETFAAHAVKMGAADKRADPETQRRQIVERAKELGGGPIGGAAALVEQMEANELAGVTSPGLLGKDGNPIPEQPLLVPTAAYVDLHKFFRRLSNSMRSVLETLQTQPAVVYGPPP